MNWDGRMHAEGGGSAPFSLFKAREKRISRNLCSSAWISRGGGAVGKQYSQHFSIQDGPFYCLLAVLFVELIASDFLSASIHPVSLATTSINSVGLGGLGI